MPLIDAKPDALSDVYAAALFDLAVEAGGQERAEKVLGELEDVLELARSDASFGEFLASRVLSRDTRRGSLQKIFEGRVGDLTLRFLMLLSQKNRLGHLSPIVASLDKRVQEAFGRVEVDVYTAAPISPEQLGGIREKLKAALGKEAIVHPYTDESLIGGMRLQIGDRLIDASVSARLRGLRDRMSRQGSAELKGRFDRLLGE